MGTTETELKQIALALGTAFAHQEHQLQRELSELDARRAEIQEKVKRAHSAEERSRQFIAGHMPDYFCPRCWVHVEKQSRLRNLPSSSKFDFWRCDVCGFDIETGS